MEKVTITLTLTMGESTWIQTLVDAGAYADEDACIRDLLRRDHEDRAPIAAIRTALIEAENSGEPTSLDVHAFKREMRGKYGRR